MKRCSYLLLIALLTAGISLTGCDLLSPGEEEPADDEPPVEEPVALEDDEDEEDEEDEEAEAPAIDEDMFILAAFELGCVAQEIEDTDEAAAINEEIYARYGLDEDSYEVASEAYGEEENVKEALEARMEACDEEMARGFAEEGAGDLEEADEEEEAEAEEAAEEAPAAQPQRQQPQARSGPARTGALRASISGSDFEDTQLTLRVRADYNVAGELRGNREGRSFLVPISGTVAENGQITASGDRRGNTVNVDGRLTEAGASGTLTGEVHQRSYRVGYNAR